MKKLLTFLSLCVLATTAWGLSLEPLTQEFTSSGRGTIQTFRVTNTQQQPVAVRVGMTTRSITTEGKEVREDASELFVVFPARLLLEPGQSQAVRVQWRGEELQERERAFRIVVEQLAVEGGEESEGLRLNFLYRYEGSVYVLPPRVENAEIALAEVTALPGIDNGRKELLLQFENRGGRHAIVRNPRVTIARRDGCGNRETITLGGDDLPRIAGTNFLAGSAVYQPVFVPASWEVGELATSFDFDIAK